MYKYDNFVENANGALQKKAYGFPLQRRLGGFTFRHTFSGVKDEFGTSYPGQGGSQPANDLKTSATFVPTTGSGCC